MTDTGPPDDGPPDDLEALDRRLRKTAETRAARERSTGAHADAAGLGAAFRLATELVAAVAVGAFLGFGLDYVAPTEPFGLIGGLVFGFAAGLRNVVRAAEKMSNAGDGSGDGGAGS